MQTTMTQTQATIYNLTNRACELGKRWGIDHGMRAFFNMYGSDTNGKEMEIAWLAAATKKFRKGTQYVSITVVS